MMKNGVFYFRISFCAIQVFVQTFMTSQTAEMTVMNLNTKGRSLRRCHINTLVSSPPLQ